MSFIPMGRGIAGPDDARAPALRLGAPLPPQLPKIEVPAPLSELDSLSEAILLAQKAIEETTGIVFAEMPEVGCLAPGKVLYWNPTFVNADPQRVEWSAPQAPTEWLNWTAQEIAKLHAQPEPRPAITLNRDIGADPAEWPPSPIDWLTL
jgi:hypothetical protein